MAASLLTNVIVSSKPKIKENENHSPNTERS